MTDEPHRNAADCRSGVLKDVYYDLQYHIHDSRLTTHDSRPLGRAKAALRLPFRSFGARGIARVEAFDPAVGVDFSPATDMNTIPRRALAIAACRLLAALTHGSAP